MVTKHRGHRATVCVVTDVFADTVLPALACRPPRVGATDLSTDRRPGAFELVGRAS